MDTGTLPRMINSGPFIFCSSKSPNMFAWVLTVCQAHSMDVLSINTTTSMNEGSSKALVTNDLPTHLTVVDPLHAEAGAHTTTMSGVFAQSFRGCDVFESTGAVLAGVVESA